MSDQNDFKNAIPNDIGDPTPKAKPQKKKRRKPDVVSVRDLKFRYGDYAVGVLRRYLTPIWKKDGKLRHFKLIKPLPTQKEFAALRTQRYTHLLSDLLSDAYCAFVDLEDECGDPPEELLPSLQDDGVQAMLQEARFIFGCLHMPEIDEQIGSLKVYYPWLNDCCLSAMEIDNWTLRRNDAVASLEAIVKVLETAKADGSRLDNDAVDAVIAELNRAIGEAESVDLPDQ